jgi:hypothetical protein
MGSRIFPMLLLAHGLCVAQWTDASPHKVRFIQVEPAVVLEVLDWGG